MLALIGLAPVLTGCQDAKGPSTQASSAPSLTVPLPVPLVSSVVSSVSSIRQQPNGAQEVTLRLTLIVTNTTTRTYVGEAPDAALARFALTFGDDPIWSYPVSVAQVVTPVTIPAGQQVTYSAKVTLADVRPYKGKVLSARATFVPAGLLSRTEIPVQ